MSTENKVVFCNDSDTAEEDSGFDNASCSQSESGTSSCIDDYNSEPRQMCKCTELQNPSIMQYYPTPWQIHDVNYMYNSQRTCQCDAANRTTTTAQRTKGNIQKTPEKVLDGTDTDGESDSVLTDIEEEGARGGDFGSHVVLGLPKNFSSVQLSVILIGDSNTGKTSLISRFADDKLVENYETTIGIDFSIAQFRLNGTRVRLQLWDTAGQEKFNAITTQYYHRAMGVVFVYDVTKPATINSIPKWNRAVEQHADPDVVKLLCGNKMDLEGQRKVTTEQGRKLAKQIGARFCEVSALETTNVFEAFQYFSRDVFLEYYAKKNPCASPSAVRLNPITPSLEQKDGCCS